MKATGKRRKTRRFNGKEYYLVGETFNWADINATLSRYKKTHYFRITPKVKGKTKRGFDIFQIWAREKTVRIKKTKKRKSRR